MLSTRIVFLTIVFRLDIIKCTPIDVTTEALVTVGERTSVTIKPRGPILPELKSMHVTSNIRNRYARTIIETKYLNPDDHAQEATFTIILPKTAFISGFSMEIDDKIYKAHVKSKTEAKKEYEQAKQSGQTAGHVEMQARNSEIFTVSVNIESLSKVLFTLTYEELLQRKHGKYEMVINLHPRQLVDDFFVIVNINETKRIINVRTPALRSGNEILDPKSVTDNPYAKINVLNEEHTDINIYFAPSKQEQKEMIIKGLDEAKGISGQFVIEYDIERDSQGGEVIIDDDYFVHFFAPSDLEPIPKHIVFVLDVSYSMHDKKIEQMKEAMQVILGELNKDDYFHLLKFSSVVQVWTPFDLPEWHYYNISQLETPSPIPANENMVLNAQNAVKNMIADGGTNIYDALGLALHLTSKGIYKESKKIQPIIIFLTDGEATVGITDSVKILEMVQSKNKDKNAAAIFTLSFGDKANTNLLRNLANKHSGFMRTIYEASDASLQLQDFYKTISSPLLTNVTFVYADRVSNFTKNKFDLFFKGNETVVTGKLNYYSTKFVSVEAKTANGSQQFIPDVFPITKKLTPDTQKEYGSLERLWAYMTIQQLLDEKYEYKKKDGNSSREEEALLIALKYSFVTPVSSLVVVKPNTTESQNPKTFEEATQIPDISPPAVTPSSGRRGRTWASTRSRPTIPSTSRKYIENYSTATESHLPAEILALPNNFSWLLTLSSGPDTITIYGQEFLLVVEKNKTVTFESKRCQENYSQTNGTCTLLSECPQIHSLLDSAYAFLKFFCTLGSEKYAGVCCIDKVDPNFQ